MRAQDGDVERASMARWSLLRKDKGEVLFYCFIVVHSALHARDGCPLKNFFNVWLCLNAILKMPFKCRKIFYEYPALDIFTEDRLVSSVFCGGVLLVCLFFKKMSASK